MFAVVDFHGIRIGECFNGLFKRHAMLFEVRRSLLRIPLKAHVASVHPMYIRPICSFSETGTHKQGASIAARFIWSNSRATRHQASGGSERACSRDPGRDPPPP